MVVVRNKRAAYDYQLGDKFTAGMVLSGNEVKSLKAGQASLAGSFVDVGDNAAWLVNAFVAPYQNTKSELTTKRRRKLLLNKSELSTLHAFRQQGKHIIPMQIKTVRGKLKIDLAVAKSRRKVDRRQYLRARDDKKLSSAVKGKQIRFSTG